MIDVRPGDEFEAGHLPYARSLPLSELKKRLRNYRGTNLVAYCRGPFCMMASEAVALLLKQGFWAFKLDDGVAEWRRRAACRVRFRVNLRFPCTTPLHSSYHYQDPVHPQRRALRFGALLQRPPVWPSALSKTPEGEVHAVPDRGCGGLRQGRAESPAEGFYNIQLMLNASSCALTAASGCLR